MTWLESHSPGVAAIDQERSKAIDKGYGPSHDSINHTVEELLRIGACYIEAAASDMEGMDYDWPHPFWPDSSIPPVREPSALDNAIRGAQFVAAAIDMIYLEAGQLHRKSNP